jgi:hypothetical protein
MRPYARGSDIRRNINLNLLFSVVLFILSSTTFCLIAFLPPSDRVCIARSVAFKRAIEAIHYEWVNFGDYLYPPSVYRHRSPRRDQAWKELMSRM